MGAATDLPTIKEIVTTYGFSSLEAPFLNALLSIDRVRRALNISSNLSWEFQSTATLEKPKDIDYSMVKDILRGEGIIHFNVGDAKTIGHWDQHGRPENASLCELCSLDLVRGEYDFLNRRPWLRDVYSRIRENDISGAALSENRQNIRRLMEGFSLMYPDDPAKVLDLLTKAFLCVFTQAKDGATVEQVFNINQIYVGAGKALDDFAEFTEEIDQALEALDEDWRQAKQDVKQALANRQQRAYNDSRLNKRIRLIAVNSDARSAAAAARSKRFDLVVVFRSSGHVQILSSNIHANGKKYRFSLAEMAKALRILESKFQSNRRLEKADWRKSGFVYFEDETACPWYLAEFLSGLFNGSLSSPDVPGSAIEKDKLWKKVIQTLPKCGLLVQKEDETWETLKVA